MTVHHFSSFDGQSFFLMRDFSVIFERTSKFIGGHRAGSLRSRRRRRRRRRRRAVFVMSIKPN